MSFISDIYSPELRRLCAELGDHEAKWGSFRDRSNAYKTELEAVMAELRKKHSMDEVDGGMAAEMAEIARIEGEMLRARCRLVAGTVDLLFRADPERYRNMLDMLTKEDFGLDISGTHLDNFLEQYHDLIDLVRSDGWWDSERPAVQENGFIWLSNGGTGIGIHRDVFYDKWYRFLSWSESELTRAGRRWAGRWAGEAAIDVEKRRALYEELRKEFDAEAK